jgi:hypothetical protein
VATQLPPRFSKLAAHVFVLKIPNADDPLLVAEWEEALVDQRRVVVTGVPFNGIQRSISSRLEVSFRGAPDGDGGIVELPDGGFDGRQGTTLKEAGDDLFGGGPIAGIERRENALAP